MSIFGVRQLSLSLSLPRARALFARTDYAKVLHSERPPEFDDPFRALWAGSQNQCDACPFMECEHIHSEPSERTNEREEE